MVQNICRSASRIYSRTTIVPIYVDDIIKNLDCDVHLYADDTVLMTSYRNPEEAFVRVTRDLEKLNMWAEKWFMSFNSTKTKYMVISTTNQPHPELSLNGERIEKVNSYPQLGLILHDKMNWSDHINKAITKANKKLA